MAISFVAAVGSTAGTSDITATPPSGFAAGDLFILAVSNSAGSRTITTDFAGYTFVREVTDGTNWWTRYYTRTAVAGDTTVTATTSSAGRWVAQMVAYRGVDTAAPLLVENGQAQLGTATTFPAPAISNTDANAWGVYHGGARGISGGSWTAGTGLVERVDTDGTLTTAANVTATFSDSNGAVATGSVTYSGTASASVDQGDGWAAFLKPAGGGTVPTFRSGGTFVTGGVEVPAGATTNDIVLIGAWVNPSTATRSVPAGFAEAPSSPTTRTGTNSMKFQVWWKRLTTSESGTYAFTDTSVSASDTVSAAFSGCVTSGSPFDVSNSASNSGSTATTSIPVTTTGADRLLMWFGGSFFTTTWTVPSGFTAAAGVSANTVRGAYKLQAAAGASGAISGTNSNTAANSYLASWVGALIGTSGALTISPSGIASLEAFGAATVTPGPVTVSPAGIATLEAFGATVVSPGTVTVSPAGIASVEAFGVASVFIGDPVLRPAGIASLEAFGATVVTPGPVTISPAGIASLESFGATNVIQMITPVGIASLEAFGASTVTPGDVTILPAGIGSLEAFGATVVIITLDPDVRRGRPVLRTTAIYELVAVARVPQPAGPPVLVEVDEIQWSGLSYADELSRPQRLDASASISTLPESIIQRIFNPHELPTELWLRRNGRVVFAGPWWGANRQGDTLTMQAAGLLGYLRYWFVTADLLYNAVDQFTIVRALVDHKQTLEHGHVGIDTTGGTLSGQLRDVTYLRDEEHPIGQRVEEMGRREGGFDVEVDPASRRLQLWYPLQGVDRSGGEDAVVFDSRNVTSSNWSFSVAPGDLASDAIGTGTSQTAGTIYSTLPNLDLRARFGRVEVAANFDGVSEQTTLDAHTQGLLDARSEVLFIPGPDIRTVPDADLSAYGVGDTIALQLDSRLGIRPFRLRKRQVSVSQTGVERASFEFV